MAPFYSSCLIFTFIFFEFELYGIFGTPASMAVRYPFWGHSFLVEKEEEKSFPKATTHHSFGVCGIFIFLPYITFWKMENVHDSSVVCPY